MTHTPPFTNWMRIAGRWQRISIATATKSRAWTSTRRPKAKPTREFEVAQVSNLLYRRFPIGPTSFFAMRDQCQALQAGSPAIQQVGNLRYVDARKRTKATTQRRRDRVR